MNNLSAVKPDKTAVLHETVLQVNALMGQGWCLTDSCLFTVATCNFCSAGQPVFSGYHKLDCSP